MTKEQFKQQVVLKMLDNSGNPFHIDNNGYKYIVQLAELVTSLVCVEDEEPEKEIEEKESKIEKICKILNEVFRERNTMQKSAVITGIINFAQVGHRTAYNYFNEAKANGIIDELPTGIILTI